MLSFSPRNVAVRKLCLNFSISLNFRLLHLQQISQQSWVQLDNSFILPSETNGFMEKRNSLSLFEEHILSLWSKNVHPKVLFSKENGSVLDKLEMFEKQMFPFFHLHWKLPNLLQNFEAGKTSQIFKKNITYIKKKEFLALFFHRKLIYFLMLFPALSAWWNKQARSWKQIDFFSLQNYSADF